MISKSWAIIDEVEKRLGINFGIDYLEYSDSIFFWKSACFIADKNGCTIRIGRGLSGRKLKEIVYHELGHCLLWNYRVPKKMLRIFWDDPGSLRIKDTDFLYSFVTNSLFLKMFCIREPQIYSLYGQINGEEEFCDVLAAVLCGKSFSRMSKRIQEKASAVNEVLSYITNS